MKFQETFGFKAVVWLMVGLTGELSFAQVSGPVAGVIERTIPHRPASRAAENATRGTPVRPSTDRAQAVAGVQAAPPPVSALQRTLTETPFLIEAPSTSPVRGAEFNANAVLSLAAATTSAGVEGTPAAARPRQPKDAGDPPTWLSATVDANFNDRFLQEQLAKIGPGVSNAFTFVRDQIGYEAYPGSLRGARGTLWSAAGNSLDKASLLIALLRAQGIGACYVRGVLSPADVQSIIASMFDPVVAANAVGYIPERYPQYDPSNDPGLIRWISDHWWVELTNGTALDPSFKGAAIGVVRGAKTTACFEVPDELRHKVVVRLKAELYTMLGGLTEETPLEVTFSTPEVYGRALTLGHFVNPYQPPALIGGFKTYTYSPYLMVDDNDADLGNNHLIRGADYQEFFSGMFAIVNTTLTRLTLELEVQDPGKAPDLRTRDLLDRIGFAARHGLGTSLGIDSSQPAFTENDLTTIFVTPGFIRPEMVTTYQDALKAISPQTEALAATLAPLTNAASPSLTSENKADLARYSNLNRWAMIAGGSVVAGAFLLDSDIYVRQMRPAHRTLAYYDSPRLTLFEARVAGSDTNSTLRMGLDLRRNVIQAVPYPGQSAFNFFAFNLAKGRVDGILEHLTVQDFLGDGNTNAPGPASPITVFQAAQSQGVSLVALGSEADIPGRLESLAISAEAKARIGVALRSGKQVNVPARMVGVNGVPSIGWWEIDARTGETVAVSEDGGNQEAVEFVLITMLIFAASVPTLVLFWSPICRSFTAQFSKPRTFIPSYGSANTGLNQFKSINSTIGNPMTIGGQQVQQNADGSLSFTVNGPTYTIPASSGAAVQACSSGSVVDFAGTDSEVIFTYFPGTNGLSGSVLSGSGVKLETVPERAFVVKAGESQVPSSFRARITNTGTNGTDFALSGAPPAGWNLLFARTNSTIPTNVTGEVSVFLQPQADTPLPAPNTDIAFALAASRSGTPSTTLTQAVHFVMPEVMSLVFTADPEVLYTSPNGSVTNTLHLLNSGNVTQSVALTLTAPTNFLTAGLTSPITLAPGQSATQELRFTAQAIAPDTDFDARVTATYGGTNQFQKQAQLRLHVAAPGALQALNAANDARTLKRDALAATLEALGQDLSQLYKNPNSDVFKSRVEAGLANLAQQLDDPLLAPFAADITAVLAAILASTPATLTSVLDALGPEMTLVSTRLQRLAQHDFEVALQPNTTQSLPDTPTKFGLCLQNKGSETTTYNLSLSALPPGITGGLNTNRITLAPGAATSPTLEAAEKAWVTLTQPTNQLTSFEFTVTASAEGAPEIARSAVGAFTAREELVQVLSVAATPPFVSPLETKTDIGTFTGGDAGEGLDLDGRFVYAVNLGASGNVGWIRDALFTDDTAPGVFAESFYLAPTWFSPNYGSTTNDDRLEVVMRSVRWSTRPGGVTLNLSNLKLGQPYKLQLLFTEKDNTSRKFDVSVENQVVAGGLCPAAVLGGSVTPSRGVVLTHRFVATNATLHILVDGRNTGYDPVLSGETLEEEAKPTTRLSARILNAVNANRDMLVSYVVKDSSNVTVVASSPIPARMSVLSSLDTFDLGALDTTTLQRGTYRIVASVSEMDGTPIPGAQGQGTLLVGLPVSGEMSLTPEALPAGDGQVAVALQINSQADYGTNGLVLLGLVDTPGDANTVCLRDGYAYVGGSTETTVMDISDPRNPRIVANFGSGQRTTLTTNHLLIQNGQTLSVYGLTNLTQPNLVGSVAGGVSGTIYQNQLETYGRFAFIHLLTFAWNDYGTPLFVRGDALMFDISNPASPKSLGLLYNSYHADYPQYPGSDYFIGQKSGIKDGIVFLPSTSASLTAVGGTGRLRMVNAQGTNKPAVLGSFDVPGTVVLNGIAVQGDRALVTGSRSAFVYRNGFVLSGNPTLTLLGITNAAAPAILGTTAEIANIDDLPYGAARVFAGTNGFYFVTGLTRNSKPLMVVVDARNPTNLLTRAIEVPAAVTWAETVGNLLYTVSSSGLAIYDLGGLVGVPVIAQVRVPNEGSSAFVPGSFNVAPDQTIHGTHYDTLVWHSTLSSTVTNQRLTWQSSVTNLTPGEARNVTLGATVHFTAWGTESSLELPALTVAGRHVLTLTPGIQTVRPGESAAYTLTVTNSTAAARTFALTLQGVPSNWVSFVSSVTVPAQSQTALPLLLRADTVAAAGDYGFTVWAQVAGGTPNMVGGTLALSGSPLAANQAYGVVVSLTPPQATAGQGTAAHYTVRLINTGNTTDEFALSAQLSAGFAAQFGGSKLEVPPGLDNYREVSLAVTPQTGTASGAVPFTVTATSAAELSVQSRATGTVSVVNLGVALGFTPASGPPGSIFNLGVTNTGQQGQTFDLSLGGSVAPSASLPAAQVTLPAGAGQTIPVSVAPLDYGQPGSLSLFALATARENTNVQARATALVQMAPQHGVTAVFEPALVGVPVPGKAYALLALRNSGNTEDAFTARIASLSGPLTANLRGPTNELAQQTGPLRLPGLASGALLLEANLTRHGTGAVQVVVSSLQNSNLTAQAVVAFRCGVWLEFTKERIIEFSFTPVPGMDHFVEYRERIQPGSAGWVELPGGPYNRGLYYLCVPANCGAFPAGGTLGDPLFIDSGNRPSRYYRLRILGAAAPPLRMRMALASALAFAPLPGYDHFVEYTDRLAADAQWRTLPRDPHNAGLAFDLQPPSPRFYRVRIQPAQPAGSSAPPAPAPQGSAPTRDGLTVRVP